MNEERVLGLVRRAISRFSLNLTGLSVLTEAATGYYMLTPLIAALAGARTVYALTKSSRFGSVEDVRMGTMRMAEPWGVDDCIEILTRRDDNRVGSADIVTNLGFVRPLNRDFLGRLKKECVIPLMWETWEYRPEDLDLEECRKLGIPVLGTDEHHAWLNTFSYIGYIALKMLMAADLEIFQSTVIVLGRGEFAERTVQTLKACGAVVYFMSSQKKDSGSPGHLAEADALVVVDHESEGEVLGKDGPVSVDILAEVNRGVTVVHLCGRIDKASLIEHGIIVVPENVAPPGYMSAATDYVGPKPLIDLHTAGLKVGEEMSRARQRGLTGFEAEMDCLKRVPFAQGFRDRHGKV